MALACHLPAVLAGVPDTTGEKAARRDLLGSDDDADVLHAPIARPLPSSTGVLAGWSEESKKCLTQMFESVRHLLRGLSACPASSQLVACVPDRGRRRMCR